MPYPLPARRNNALALLVAAALLGGISAAHASDALPTLNGRDSDVDAFLDRLLLDPAPGQGAQDDPAAATDLAARLDCVMRPSASVSLAAPMPGLLAEVSAERGDRVKAGQVVARLEDGMEAASVALDRLRASSDTEERARMAEAETAAKQAERARFLAERELMPEREVETLLTAERVTKLQAELSDHEHEVVKLELARSAAALERRRIVSPVDGVVIEKKLSAGEYADASNPILRVVTLDPLRVETFAPAAFFGRLHKGSKATVYPAPPLTGAYEAEVEVVDPVFNAAGGVFGVRLLLANTDGKLPGDYRCSVSFQPSPGG